MEAIALPRRRFRLKRVLKWFGIGACALLLLAIGFCLLFSSFVYTDGRYIYGLFAGSIGVERGSHRVEWSLGERWLDWKDFAETWHGWIKWRPGSHLWIPLWIPLGLFGAPTAYLWFLDRRRPDKSKCTNCGYNLTGNISGVCPECGAAVERAG